VSRQIDDAAGRLARGRAAIAAARPTASAPADLEKLDGAFADLQGELQQIYGVLQGADAAPTAQARTAVTERLTSLASLERRLAALVPGSGR